MLSTPIGLAVALAMQGDPPAGGSMTIALNSSLQSTAGTTSYAASAFTPAANSYLIAFVAVTASSVAGSMTGGGLTWNKQGTEVAFGSTSAHRLHCFTAEVGGSPVSTTPTFDCTGDAGSACLIAVYEVGGLNATEIAEFVTDNDIVADSTPSVPFTAMNTTELVLVAFASADASAPTGITAPSNFTGYSELTQETPAVRLGTAYRNTGETDTPISFTADGDATDYWASCGLRLTPA